MWYYVATYSFELKLNIRLPTFIQSHQSCSYNSTLLFHGKIVQNWGSSSHFHGKRQLFEIYPFYNSVFITLFFQVIEYFFSGFNQFKNTFLSHNKNTTKQVSRHNSSVTNNYFFLGIKMSFTYENILEDLRSSRITPSRTNSTYPLDVQNWFWRLFITELDLPIFCKVLQSWVEKFSEVFTVEAKRIWEITNGTYRDVLKKFKSFVEKPIELPGMYNTWFLN